MSIVVARETLELSLRDQVAHFQIEEGKLVHICQMSEIGAAQVGRNLNISTRCVANRLRKSFSQV